MKIIVKINKSAKPTPAKTEFPLFEITLLTREEYGRYREHIPSVDHLWWLKNAFDEHFVCCIDERDAGVIAFGHREAGVRPVFKVKMPNPGYRPGDIIDLFNQDLIILSWKNDNAILLYKDIVATHRFDGRTTNWATSELKKWLETDFLQEIAGKIDGLFEKESQGPKSSVPDAGSNATDIKFGSISLLTPKEYHTYKKFIPQINEPWWLSFTASDSAIAVMPNSNKHGVYHMSACLGVRPKLIVPNKSGTRLGSKIQLGSITWTVIDIQPTHTVIISDEAVTHRPFAGLSDWLEEDVSDFIM